MGRVTYLITAAKETWEELLSGKKEKVRVSTALLKIILLKHGDQAIKDNVEHTLKKRSLGAGVYEIRFERLVGE